MFLGFKSMETAEMEGRTTLYFMNEILAVCFQNRLKDYKFDELES